MGKLVQVATNTVTSPVSSVTLTGIDSDDVYMVTIANYQPVTDNTHFRARVTVSGTADTTANYDYAGKYLHSTVAFFNHSGTNQTYLQTTALGSGTNEKSNQIFYLYNFNNSSEYSFITIEDSSIDQAGVLLGIQGGMVHTVAQSCNGIQFFQSSGNINTGAVFTLYKVV